MHSDYKTWKKWFGVFFKKYSNVKDKFTLKSRGMAPCFYWSIVDFQYCVSFRCTAQWFSYITKCVRMCVRHSGCLTLWDPMDCSLPGSSVHGILQTRILEWVAILFSRGSSRPRDWTWVSHIAGRLFTTWATRGAHIIEYIYFRFFSTIDNYKTLSIVPCAIW